MKKYKYIAGLLLAGSISFSACTDNFEEQNSAQIAFTDDLQKTDFNKYFAPFDIIQQGIFYNYDNGGGKNWPWQIIQNLGADMFSGYMHDFNGKFNANNSTYNLNDGWTSTAWTYTYDFIMPQVATAERLTKGEMPAFYGIAKILKVELMHRIADQYGPIVYSDFGKENPNPESLKEVYALFFNDLEEAITLIKDVLSKDPAKDASFNDGDIITPNGTLTDWLKFANSLRLRLAMRISNVDATLARTQAEKSLKDPTMLLAEVTDLIAVKGTNGYTNPLGEVSNAWAEVFMNANMESYMVGFNDPRVSIYFDNAIEKDYEKAYKGIPQGTGVSNDKYKTYSRTTVIKTTTPAVLMNAAEVWFLRAEAALRGYSTSDNAKACYEKGIEISFTQWGAGSTANYLISESKPIAYVDAFDPQFNKAAQSTATVKWDDSISPEQKLEKIAIQKWIALFPDGVEGWSEQRRTGYPKLFPVTVNNSAGKIDTKIGIRRLWFPQTFISADATLYNKLVSSLGGVDNGGTRLWWDTGNNKF